MKSLPDNPFAKLSLAEYGARLRKREISAESATSALLDRIDLLNPKLNAFHYVARDAAMKNAREIDRQLKEGTDFGPLMAAATLIIAPLIAGFLLAQRRFIEGIALTGMK